MKYDWGLTGDKFFEQTLGKVSMLKAAGSPCSDEDRPSYIQRAFEKIEAFDSESALDCLYDAFRHLLPFTTALSDSLPDVMRWRRRWAASAIVPLPYGVYSRLIPSSPPTHAQASSKTRPSGRNCLVRREDTAWNWVGLSVVAAGAQHIRGGGRRGRRPAIAVVHQPYLRSTPVVPSGLPPPRQLCLLSESIDPAMTKERIEMESLLNKSKPKFEPPLQNH